MPVGRVEALVPEDEPEPVLPDAVEPELAGPEEFVPAALVPAELVLPLELPLMPADPLLDPLVLLVPDALPGVPDTLDVVRAWFIAESQHWVPDVAPVVPEPVAPEPVVPEPVEL